MSESYYGFVLDDGTVISHHGILGQKWGNRNGPPYPLDDDDHSARERKKGWRASLNGRSKTNKKVNTKTSKNKGNKKKSNWQKAVQMTKQVSRDYEKKTGKHINTVDDAKKMAKNTAKKVLITEAVVSVLPHVLLAATLFTVAAVNKSEQSKRAKQQVAGLLESGMEHVIYRNRRKGYTVYG